MQTELAQLVGSKKADALTSTRIDFNDASGPWWTSQLSYDSEVQVSERVDEFLQFARFCSRPESEASIFVGHSLFFRTVCKRLSPELAQNRGPEMAEKLKSKKLGHAAVLAITVRYTDEAGLCSGPPVVEDAALLFGSTFHEH